MSRVSRPQRILLCASFFACLIGTLLAVAWTAAKSARGETDSQTARVQPKAVSPLRLELATTAAPLTSDRMTTIMAHFHNTSSRLSSVPDGDTIMRGFTLQVLHEGHAVPMTAYARKSIKQRSLSHQVFGVAPNSTLSYRLVLGALYDMSDAGEYTIHASYLIDPYTGETLQAKPLTIEIKPGAAISSIPPSAKDAAAIQAALEEEYKQEKSKAVPADSSSSTQPPVDAAPR